MATENPAPARRGRPRVAPPAPTVESLTIKLNYANARCRFAWAKYYEAVRSDLHDDWGHYTILERVVSEDAMPVHIKNELKEMATALKKKWECPVCQDFIPEGELEITNCGHFYCKGCLDTLKEHHKNKGDPKWSCAVCRRKHGYRDEE